MELLAASLGCTPCQIFNDSTGWLVLMHVTRPGMVPVSVCPPSGELVLLMCRQCRICHGCWGSSPTRSACNHVQCRGLPAPRRAVSNGSITFQSGQWLGSCQEQLAPFGGVSSSMGVLSCSALFPSGQATELGFVSLGVPKAAAVCGDADQTSPGRAAVEAQGEF